jgi:hypothetical protein
MTNFFLSHENNRDGLEARATNIYPKTKQKTFIMLATSGGYSGSCWWYHIESYQERAHGGEKGSDLIKFSESSL